MDITSFTHTTKNGKPRYDVSLGSTADGVRIVVDTPAGKRLCKESIDYFTKIAMKKHNYNKTQERMLTKLANKKVAAMNAK